MTHRRNFLKILLSMKVFFPGITLKKSQAKPTYKYQPVKGRIMSKWAKEVTPDKVLPEYPRPQMVRDDWKNLNGLWDYDIIPKTDKLPDNTNFSNKILVPFCIESALSGVGKRVTPEDTLIYKRTFTVPTNWGKKRILLHFGAVDWKASVWINKKKADEHKGGYDPFSIDITEYIKPGNKQELIVMVWDPTDTGTQPRGKQVTTPRGIWYTPVTGIWQTVWLEPVPETYIESIYPEPDIDKKELKLTIKANQPISNITVEIKSSGKRIHQSGSAVGPGKTHKISHSYPIKDMKLWTPDNPLLYDIEIKIENGIDKVKSYFGMRKVHLEKDKYGYQRLMLNNKPVFQYGPLDQGWWPDGLYTAPTDEALKFDIDITKKSGFNMIRKHVKVEPARWYYHCDKIGILVWQDMPSGFQVAERPTQQIKATAKEEWKRPKESAAQFEKEYEALITNFKHFPSIVMWVPFNEGWGQYDTIRIAKWTKKTDTTRLVNPISGWLDREAGDVYDVHQYPGPGMEPAGQFKNRAMVLGEFGGLGLAIKEHLWGSDRNWGYETLDQKDVLNNKYEKLINSLIPMRHLGLAAAVYTQTTDVEGEVNGLMTYDRQMIKYDFKKLHQIHSKLYLPFSTAEFVLPDSELKPQEWKYRIKKPVNAADWTKIDFNDEKWKKGKAPFVAGIAPFIPKGTNFKSQTIWMRKRFNLKKIPKGMSLRVYSSGPVEIFINGKQVLKITLKAKRHYTDINISEHIKLLKKGKNVLCAYFKKEKGLKCIDLGLYVYDI